VQSISSKRCSVAYNSVFGSFEDGSDQDSQHRRLKSASTGCMKNESLVSARGRQSGTAWKRSGGIHVWMVWGYKWIIL